MTPSNDEVVARLRASFQAHAARTTVGGDRLGELADVTASKHPRPLVAAMSAAAAVVAVAGVAAVVSQVGGHPTTSIGSGGVPVASAAAGGVPVASTASAGQAGDTSPRSDCELQNYYVIASKSQLQALTYLLPSAPAGYTMYGAWGTIDRSMCAGSATWYVEYDDANGFANTDNRAIQLMATSADPSLVPTAGSVKNAPASTPTAPSSNPASSATAGSVVSGTPVTVGGVMGQFYDNKGAGMLTWTASGVRFQLSAPSNDGPVSLIALANSLVHVSADDPRIKPPANCEVPAGEVCPG
jgi:hypothetical protein